MALSRDAGADVAFARIVAHLRDEIAECQRWSEERDSATEAIRGGWFPVPADHDFADADEYLATAERNLTADAAWHRREALRLQYQLITIRRGYIGRARPCAPSPPLRRTSSRARGHRSRTTRRVASRSAGGGSDGPSAGEGDPPGSPRPRTLPAVLRGVSEVPS